jgi:hypothetical protein
MNTIKDQKPSEETRDRVSRNWHNLDNRLAIIAETAYFKSEKRGFQIGHDIKDWLEAESEMAEIMGQD